MTFIITLIALVIERFFHWNHLRRWRWFSTYQQWLSHSRLNHLPSVLLLIICVLPLALIVGLINYLLTGWLYDSLKLLFGVIVLVYCMGPANLWLQVFGCINQLHQEDLQLAVSSVQAAFGVNHADSAQMFHQAFTRAIFLAAFSRVFAVVFWFVILGPVGAVLYRMIVLLGTESPLGLTHIAKTWQRFLDWLPVRIFTFIFALGGHFTEVFAHWKDMIFNRPDANELMLTECGVAALDIREGATIPEDGAAEKDAVTLLDRVFVMALGMLAIIVLIF